MTCMYIDLEKSRFKLSLSEIGIVLTKWFDHGVGNVKRHELKRQRVDEEL